MAGRVNVTRRQAFEALLGFQMDFHSPHFTGLSAGAQEFVRLLLTEDAAARPTPEEALQHHWVQVPTLQWSPGSSSSSSLRASPGLAILRQGSCMSMQRHWVEVPTVNHLFGPCVLPHPTNTAIKACEEQPVYQGNVQLD